MPKNTNRQEVITIRSGLIRVEELTDAELLERTLRTTDPLSLANLSRVPPPDGVILILEMAYDSVDKVACVYEGHKHNKGFVLRDPNGQRYLVGNTCGRKKHGVEWEQVIEDSKAQVDRQKYLRRLKAVGLAIFGETDWLSPLHTDPRILAVDEARRAVRAFSADIFEICEVTLLKNGGRVFEEVKVRDHQAEQRQKQEWVEQNRRYDEINQPGYGRRHIETQQKAFIAQHGSGFILKPAVEKYKSEQREIGVLEGAVLFTSTAPLATRTQNTVQELMVVGEKARAMQYQSDMKQISMLSTTLLRRLRELIGEAAAAQAFFHPRNLDLLVKLLSPRLRHLDFKSGDGWLSITDTGDGSTKTLRRPSQLTPIDPEVIDLIEEQIRAEPSNS